MIPLLFACVSAPTGPSPDASGETGDKPLPDSADTAEDPSGNLLVAPSPNQQATTDFGVQVGVSRRFGRR